MSLEELFKSQEDEVMALKRACWEGLRFEDEGEG